MTETLSIVRSQTAQAPHIVVADDNIDMGGLIALLLRSRGFDVAVASNGQAALEIILSAGADGLVSDFHMPGLDGLSLCRVLRGLRAYTALPIVVFTGVDWSDPCLLPLRHMNDLRILHKPTGFGEIATALMEMILVARAAGRGFADCSAVRSMRAENVDRGGSPNQNLAGAHEDASQRSPRRPTVDMIR